MSKWGGVAQKRGVLYGDGDFHQEIVRGGQRGYVRVLHQPIGSDDARGEDGTTRLGRAVGGTHDGEDDGASAPERSKEGLLDS